MVRTAFQAFCSSACTSTGVVCCRTRISAPAGCRIVTQAMPGDNYGMARIIKQSALVWRKLLAVNGSSRS